MSQVQYFMKPNFIDSAVKNMNTLINGGGNWANAQNTNYQNKIPPV